LDLPDEPKRIESFDISHMQGTDTVASMVVWEDGRMKKSDYRKFIIRGLGGAGHTAPGEDLVAISASTGIPAGASAQPGPRHSASGENVAAHGASPVATERAPDQIAAAERIELLPARKNLPTIPPGQNDDFASMYETVLRRYRRVQEEEKPMPSLILIDGGIGQLHAAAQALDALQIINQPLASIAKKEEILYIYGREDEPCILDRHSPVLHLIQQIRDETHRFAVTFHRLRRGKRQTRSALNDIPGIGAATARKLLREFGSIANLRRADLERLSRIVPRKTAERILAQLPANQRPEHPGDEHL
jgi:excinuclease UvrABC nuclease subunit